MNKSRIELWSLVHALDFDEIVIPADCKSGLFKCRLIYKDSIETVEFSSYKAREIASLKLVRADGIEYSHKYLDRTPFQELLKQNDGFDELILVKHGLITDSTYSNLAFYDGSQWFTPASPLLRGTRRQHLLEQGKIVEMDIKPGDLGRFSQLSLINAMMDLGELTFPIKKAAGCSGF